MQLVVRFAPDSDYEAPNLAAVLADPARLKLYHFARFDLAAIRYYLRVVAAPVSCTKTASRLIRTRLNCINCNFSEVGGDGR